MFQLSILQILVLALINILFVLMGVAYYTLIERKIMSAIQRRYGLNVVSIWKLFQLFIAGLKALLKEIIIPRKSNKIIFIGAPLGALILANAGWIIIPPNICSFIIDINFGVLYFSSLLVYNPEYFKIFWIGLLDGAGSIEVNHWQEQTLQFCITIKLTNTEQNKKMFVLLYDVLLIGKISIVQKDQFIIWVIQTRTDIEKAVLILQKYRPLTSRRVCEFAFLEQCLLRNNVAWYLKNRSIVYGVNQDIIIYRFIEAKGNFYVRTHTKNYFSISHFMDDYLIIAISKYFGAGGTIRQQPHYSIVMGVDKKIEVVIYTYALIIYKKQILLNISNHFHEYNLLGSKKIQADWFYSNIKKI